MRKVGLLWFPALVPYPVLQPNSHPEASIGVLQPPSRPFIHVPASPSPAARSLCDLPWWPSAPLPLRPEDCFTLSSICPDPFHSLWRLPTPRLQPPESSVPLCADLPALIRLLTSCSSPTTLPGSLLMALFLLSTYLSQQIRLICWLVLPPPLKKNLENQHHQISYIAFSTQLTIWESSRLQLSIHFYFLQTKYYFECKEMSIIFLSSLKNQWGLCESCNNYVLDIEAKNS